MSPVLVFARPPRLGVLFALIVLTSGCVGPRHADDTAPPPPSRGESSDESGIVTVSNGVRIVHRDWAELGYRWQWSTMPLVAGNGRVDRVDVLDTAVAVQSEDSWTALVHANTGRRLWQVRNTSPLTRFVGNIRVNDYLISCGRPELFLMEFGSGNLIARQPVDVVVTTRPVVYGGLAVFGTPTGEVLCHRFGKQDGDPLPPPFDEGAREWGYGLEGAITSKPVQLGRTAGIVTQAGEVFFVDIPTGSGLGRSRISGGMSTDPVTDGELMFVASLDQSIYAFSPADSTWLWRYRTDAPLKTQPAWHGGVLYVHVDSEGLVAFDVSRAARDANRFGARLWANNSVSGEVVAVRSDELVVWDGEHATLIDRVAGDVLSRVALPRITRLIASDFVDGDLYALADNGLLAKFSPR